MGRIRTQGIQFLFEIINGDQSVPENFYIRWCEEAEDEISDTAGLADLTELTGNGYSPKAVASADMTSAAGGTNGRTLTTQEVTFTADGGNWNLAKTAYLATSSDNSGKLVCTNPINSGSGIALLDTENYDFTIQLACEPPAS